MDWVIGIATLIILGLIVGAIAKFLMPGDDPGGIVVTGILGILGAILGGWIASALQIGGISGFDWRSLVTAVGGALLLLLAYRAFRMLSPGSPGSSYAAGSTGSAPLRTYGSRDTDVAETNLADVAQGSMTSEFVESLGSKVGESPNQVRRALEAMIPTVLAGVRNQAATPSGASRLFDLAKGAAQGGLGRHLAEGDLEAVGRQSQSWLSAIFGDKLGALIAWLARSVGINESSASKLMGVASALVMSTLGKTILQKGLDASSFGRLLSSQSGWLSKLLPAGLGDVPGMRSLADFGDRAAQGARVAVDTGKRAGSAAYRETAEAAREGSRLASALLPLALLLVPLLAFAWLMRGKASQIRPPDIDVATRPTAPVVEAPRIRAPEAPRVEAVARPEIPVVEADRTEASVARPTFPPSPSLSEVELPDGSTLSLPESSLLAEQYSYLSDSTATEDRSFIFDGLEFEADSIRELPETESAIANQAALLRAFPSVTLHLKGHTDPSGDPAADRARSLARADALKDLLVKAGAPADRITTEGAGSEEPVADNEAAEGRSKNGRIELSLNKSS